MKPSHAASLLLALLPLTAAALDPFDTESEVAAAAICQPGREDAVLGLADAVDAALCANPQTREAWANARAAAATLGVAEAAWLPTLSASATTEANRLGGQRSDQNSIAANLSWLVFDFGGRSAAIDSARQLLAASNATRDATVQAAFLNALQAWYTVHGNRAALAAAQESERSAGESLKAAEARYKAGVGTPADTLQARTAWSQAQLTRIQAEGNLKTAEGALAAAIGRDAQRPVKIAALPAIDPPASFERDLDALVAEARRRRPDLRAAEAQLASAQAGISAARAAGLPNLSLGMSAGRSSIDNGPSAGSGSIGLTLTVPLFSGFATNYRIRAAEAQAEARAATRERLSLQVAQDVWNAWQALTTATQSVRSSADLLASAEQSEKVARGRYKAGVGSILDLLSAQSALASARQQRVQALYGWNVSRATLAQAMGSLDLSLLQGDGTPPLPAAATRESPSK
ncbi:MAG TPA: TolC family protein [Rhodocyclaceae bacterium]